MGFLTFCLMLVLVSAGVVWYVGPTLAGIVVDETRRENPYFLFQLLPAAATAVDDREPSYRARFTALAGEEEGRLLWQGGSVDVAEGSLLLDMAAAQLLAFKSGVDLVQMLTSSAYRALDAGFGEMTVHQLGSVTPPHELAMERATVAVLYQAESTAVAPLGVPGDSGWLTLLPRYDGTVHWEAEVSVIGGRQPWNRILLLQFPTTAMAYGWLQDPVTVTERAIAAKQVASLTALVIQPGGFVPR